MSEGFEAGLALIDQLGESGELDSYYLYDAARADLLRRMGKSKRATAAYERALALTTNAVERRYLGQRMAHIS